MCRNDRVIDSKVKFRNQMKATTTKNHISKLRVIRVISVASCVLTALNLVSSAIAGTTYIYTGNIYNQLGGTYQSGGPYALSIEFTTTLMGPALNNLAFSDITTTVTSYSFTDGSGLTLNDNNNGIPNVEIEVATGASGNILRWFVGAYTSPSATTQMQSNWQSPTSFIPGADFSETTPNLAGDYGFVEGDPGTW